MFLLTPASLLALTTLIMSTLLALTSSNWFIAWMAMEINLLSFIPLMMSPGSNQETEASIKYFLAQALGSALMLLSSMSMWYITLTPTWWAPLLIMSLLLKLGAAPCHFWFPSVMTSLSWSNALLLTTWQKLAPLGLICFTSVNSPFLSSFASLIAALNALIGGVLGMNQTHLRTLLAYSSITHMGWMISAMCVNNPYLAMSYFLFYSLITAPMFMLLHTQKVVRSSQFLKLITSSKLTLLGLSVLLMSLAGLPPLTGFIPKWMMIVALSNINHIVLIPLLLGSYLNLFFYLNLVFNGMTSFSHHSYPMKTLTSTNTPTLFLLATGLLGVIPILLYAVTLLNKS